MVLGFDDGPFPPFAKIERGRHAALLVGTLMRTPRPLWVSARLILVDGLDATEKALSIISSAPLKPKIIMLSGVTFGGFNLIDAEDLYRLSGIPVIIVTDRLPDLVSIKRALKKHFDDWEHRYGIISKFYPLNKTHVIFGKKPVYFTSIGISREEASEIIKNTCVRGRIPEPLRFSGLVARRLTELLGPFKVKAVGEV